MSQETRTRPSPDDPRFEPSKRETDQPDQSSSAVVSMGEDAFKSTRRRSFLKGVGAGFVGGLVATGLASVSSDLGEMATQAVEATDPEPAPGSEPQTLDYQFGQYGFTGARWENGGDLAIVFQRRHDLDGWGIKHAYDGRADRAIVQGAAPDRAGEVIAPFIKALAASGRPYGSARFQLIGYEGSFGDGFNIPERRVGRVPFDVPTSMMPPGTLRGQ